MKNYNALVEKHRELILAAERYIWKNPETGYKEFKTSKYMEDRFLELGYDIIKVDRKGFYLGEREFEKGEIFFLLDAIQMLFT